MHHGYAQWNTFQDFRDVVEGRAPSNWSLADSFRKRPLLDSLKWALDELNASVRYKVKVGRAGRADLPGRAVLVEVTKCHDDKKLLLRYSLGVCLLFLAGVGLMGAGSWITFGLGWCLMFVGVVLVSIRSPCRFSASLGGVVTG